MASSVAEPEVPQEANGAENANNLKRRQSDASEQESKRQRTSPGKSSPQATKEEDQTEQASKDSPDITTKPAHETTAEIPRESRKKSGVTDEKQRSKRLFGALLGNLNRPSDRVSKRRAEIEERRKAELQKQDDERLEDRQRRLEELAVRRKREQINVDEQIMRSRHENLLNAANFLQTKTEPKIYYRPWDLLPDEEDRIDDQIADAKAQIEDEVAAFEVEKRKRLEELGETIEAPKAEEDVAAAPDNGDSAPEQAVSPAQVSGAEKPSGDTADQPPPGEPTNTTDMPGSEVPDSDNGKDPMDEVDKQEEPASANIEEKSEKPNTPQEVDSKQPSDDQKEEVEEEGDHVVVGDEDTVEY